MAAKLPYMLSTGLIPKIFEKIQHARRPDRFTQDFLETKLGHSGGSARAIIPLLKRLGFIGSDGVPTDLYDQFRNTETQGTAMAEGIRSAFSELFDRNEYVYEMSKDKLTGLIMEITGGAKEDRNVIATVSTFLALKDMADFEAEEEDQESYSRINESIPPSEPQRLANQNSGPPNPNEQLELRMGYTINLNLPETSDPEVFNAIFKSLKENLL